MTLGRFKLDKQDCLIGIVALAGVIVYVVASAVLHKVGFPLDDSWIHQTYGRNLAQRGEWAFVPGEPSVASTSPLFTVLLAVGYFLHLPFFVWTFALGALALAGTGWIGRRLGAIMFPKLPLAGLWTGLAMVITWHLVWAASSGMETILFCMLSLALVWSGWRELVVHPSGDDPRRAFKRGLLTGVIGALLTLARPEGAGLVGLTGLGVLLAWPYPRSRQGWWIYVAWGVGVAAAWLIVLAPYLALNYHIDGALLPNTAAAKQAEHAPIHQHWAVWERYGRLLLPLFAGGLIMLLPGILFGIYGIARQAAKKRADVLFLLPLAWAFVDLTAYTLRLPANYQHGRYVMPMLPHLLLYGVGGTLALVHAGRRQLIPRILSRSLALAAALITVGFWGIGARQYAQDVRIINTEMVDTARWVEKNLPPDELLAVHDIGALGYYAPRPIFDLAGLVSPEIVPIITDYQAVMGMMCERGVRYLMVLPDQRPAPLDDPRLGAAPIFVTRAPYSPAAGGGNMTIYQMQWPEQCH
ncbi:MAG: hypothetical protein HY866_19730 [Chloroflexi bacterium]|nr:hypothetical protein [Chloroflexota bacterium]